MLSMGVDVTEFAAGEIVSVAIKCGLSETELWLQLINQWLVI